MQNSFPAERLELSVIETQIAIPSRFSFQREASVQALIPSVPTQEIEEAIYYNAVMLSLEISQAFKDSMHLNSLQRTG